MASLEAKGSLKPDEESGEPFKPTWPTVYDEAMDMLKLSLLMYGMADLRELAREDKLSNGDSAEKAKLLDLPIPASNVFRVYSQNLDILNASLGESNTKLYGSAIESLIKSSNLSVGRKDIVIFDDANTEEELVYGLAVNDSKKRIDVAFRGSVTKRDAKQNFKALFSDIPNPVKSETGALTPETIGIHQGFREYLYGIDDPLPSSKLKKDKRAIILEQMASLCEEHPGYCVYVTGHSLGGALATLMAFEAAASTDARIPKPVTCVSIASPKVGNIEFRQAVAVLEKESKLRCLRVVNFADPITVGEVVPPLLAIASTFCCKRMLYEHVGARLVLFPVATNTFTLSYKIVSWYHKQFLPLLELLTHVKRFVFRLLVYVVLCIPGLSCKMGSELFENHMCETYMRRLAYYKERIEKLHLNELYNEKLKTGLYHA